MRWLTLWIDLRPEALDAVTAMLSALGIDSLRIEDEEEFREFLEQNREAWDYVDEGLEAEMRGRCRVTFYLPENEQGFSQLAQSRIALQSLREAHPEFGPLLLELETVEEDDWANSWKQYYKPIPVGDRLLIVPQWETADPGDRTPVVLDPGLTFGTGEHETTRLCLEILDQWVQGGERMLDVGCGSGILSIAAVRLGAASALAVDIDETCRRVARENAALNGIGPDRCTVLTGDLLSDPDLRRRIGGGYDLVCANIVADVILRLAPVLPDLLAPGGRWICSGVIDTRAQEVRTGLRSAGLDVQKTRTDRGWYAFAGTVSER